MILGAKYIARHYSAVNGKPDSIYAVAVHPGVVNTQMQDAWERAYPGMLGKILRPLNLAAGRSVEQGAYSAM